MYSYIHMEHTHAACTCREYNHSHHLIQCVKVVTAILSGTGSLQFGFICDVLVT